MDSDKDQQALAWQQIIRNKAFDNVRVQRGESWVDAACRTLDELIDQKEQAEKTLPEFPKYYSSVNNEWTRDDLPERSEIVELSRCTYESGLSSNSFALDVLGLIVDHLNAHHPKPDADSFSDRVWKRAYESMRRERDEWKARADKWHGAWQRSAPVPISSADIDRALINVTSNAMNYPNPSQMLGKDSGPLRRKCVDAVCALFGIETEPADPVEAKARELFEATDESIWTWATAPVQTQDMYRRIAEHILWQEDRHVDQ